MYAFKNTIEIVNVQKINIKVKNFITGRSLVILIDNYSESHKIDNINQSIDYE